MDSKQVIATEARDLREGDVIRLRDDLHSKIKSIRFADDAFVVGGKFGKTAAAVVVETDDATFSVHPGHLIGKIAEAETNEAWNRKLQ